MRACICYGPVESGKAKLPAASAARVNKLTRMLWWCAFIFKLCGPAHAHTTCPNVFSPHELPLALLFHHWAYGTHPLISHALWCPSPFPGLPPSATTSPSALPTASRRTSPTTTSSSTTEDDAGACLPVCHAWQGRDCVARQDVEQHGRVLCSKGTPDRGGTVRHQAKGPSGLELHRGELGPAAPRPQGYCCVRHPRVPVVAGCLQLPLVCHRRRCCRLWFASDYLPRV